MNNRGAHSGYGLVELMLALLLALFLLGALISLLVQGRKAYGLQTRYARVQENARVALELMAKDLRMAGYFGCVPRAGNIANHASTVTGSLSDAAQRLEGYEQGRSAWSPSGGKEKLNAITPDSDGITVRFADPAESFALTRPVTGDPLQIELPAGADFRTGDVLVISDCDRADVFQTVAVADGRLRPNAIGKAYAVGARVARLRAARYFVGKSNLTGVPALKRQVLQGGGSTSTEELAQGIENLQLLYGEDTNFDGRPDVYRHADTVHDWSRVITIQAGLLARSMDEYGAEAERDPITHEILDHAFDDPKNQRLQRQVLSTTLVVRNTPGCIDPCTQNPD